MRDNWLSNRIFKSFDDIVGHCCDAWNKLTDQPWRIMSHRTARLALPVMIPETRYYAKGPLSELTGNSQIACVMIQGGVEGRAMPSAVRLREDCSAEELRALARRSKDVNQRIVCVKFCKGGHGVGWVMRLGGGGFSCASRDRSC